MSNLFKGRIRLLPAPSGDIRLTGNEGIPTKAFSLMLLATVLSLRQIAFRGWSYRRKGPWLVPSYP